MHIITRQIHIQNSLIDSSGSIWQQLTLKEHQKWATLSAIALDGRAQRQKLKLA